MANSAQAPMQSLLSDPTASLTIDSLTSAPRGSFSMADGDDVELAAMVATYQGEYQKWIRNHPEVNKELSRSELGTIQKWIRNHPEVN